MEKLGLQGDHRVNIIKLQVMFEWNLEWDCRGQISLPTGMGGKLKNPSSCTVPGRKPPKIGPMTWLILFRTVI